MSKIKHKNFGNYKISFCISCMNRLGHLQQTLPKNIIHNISYPNIEFVVLDYNSSDKMCDWIKHKFRYLIKKGLLIFGRYEDAKYFHMSHAKNMAHRLATGDILCNIDADTFTNRKLANCINDFFNKHANVFLSGREKFTGRLCFSKKDFINLNGYNENIHGWGHEDTDIFLRGKKSGLQDITLPDKYSNYRELHINHDDDIRVKNLQPEYQDKKITYKMDRHPDELPWTCGLGKIKVNFNKKLTKII